VRSIRPLFHATSAKKTRRISVARPRGGLLEWQQVSAPVEGSLSRGKYGPIGCYLDQPESCNLGTDLPKTKRVTWTAGGRAEVGFANTFNHGGGYAYRLCPEGAEQTEECFQNHHLRFAGNQSIVRWTTGKEQDIPALTLASGTHPPNSQWRAMPIAGCSGSGGCTYSFPLHPLPVSGTSKGDEWPFSIVDLVEVPNVTAGGYTVSWRWDTEINPQVWTNCADVTIVNDGPTPTTTPTPTTDPLATTSAAPTLPPYVPKNPTCCWSKWGDKDSCGGYHGSRGRCNTDFNKYCSGNGDCTTASEVVV